MIEVRKAKTEEMQEIVRVANAAFAPEREEGFDFQWVMPKAYKAGADTASDHTLVTEDGEIVALSGNLPGKIRTPYGEYPFGIVGTVSTLPSCRGKGYMKRLMLSMEQEDKARGLVFSALGGLRKRYNRYGYEKCTSTYCFTVGEYCLREYPPLVGVSLRLAKKEDLNALYALYQSKAPAVFRAKQSFFDCLSFSRSFLYVVEREGEIVGYFNLSQRKNGIYEIVLADNALLPYVLSAFFSSANCNSISVYVSALNAPLIRALDGFAEDKSLCDGLQIKVYDMQRFLQMLLELNAPYLPQFAEENVTVEGVCYRLLLAQGRAAVQVEPSANKALAAATAGESDRLAGEKNYTSAQFLRFALGDGLTPLCRASTIFPLAFGIEEPDMF